MQTVWAVHDWEFVINELIEKLESLSPDSRGKYKFQHGANYKELYSTVLREILNAKNW